MGYQRGLPASPEHIFWSCFGPHDREVEGSLVMSTGLRQANGNHANGNKGRGIRGASPPGAPPLTADRDRRNHRDRVRLLRGLIAVGFAAFLFALCRVVTALT